MNGLLIKDMQLLKMQKKFFVVIVAIAVFTTVITKDISFLMGYLSFIFPMLAITTISYDEFDNGNAFLFTLPISRGLYVVEKYVLGIFLGLFALCLSVLVSLIFGAVNGMSAVLEGLPAVPAVFAGALMLLSVMLPLQFKFGAERSRIVFIAASGVMLVLGFVGKKLLDAKNIDLSAITNMLSKLNIGILIAAIAVTVLGIFFLSVALSIGIMKKKEF